MVGIEPATNGLQNRCSTAELRRRNGSWRIKGMKRIALAELVVNGYENGPWSWSRTVENYVDLGGR